MYSSSNKKKTIFHIALLLFSSKQLSISRNEKKSRNWIRICSNFRLGFPIPPETMKFECHFDHLFQLVRSKSCRLICRVRDRAFNHFGYRCWITISFNKRIRVLFSIRSFFFFFLRYDYSETNLTIIQWSSFAKNKKKRKPHVRTKCVFFFFQRRKWNRVERLISFCILLFEKRSID